VRLPGVDPRLRCAECGREAEDNTEAGVVFTGAMSQTTNQSLDGPYGITTGPGGALWFTNRGDFESIGRARILSGG
jgi:hypothetical protein